jgi:hypothetical protein
MSTKNTSVKKDDWVKKIVSNLQEIPAIKIISGFIGDSLKEKHIRVYSDIKLETYIEISIDDVLHSRERTFEENPDGGSILWVNNASNVVVKSNSANNNLFEGNLANQYLKNAADANLKWDWPTDETFCHRTCDGQIGCGPHPKPSRTHDPCTTPEFGCYGPSDKPHLCNTTQINHCNPGDCNERVDVWKKNIHPYNKANIYNPPTMIDEICSPTINDAICSPTDAYLICSPRTMQPGC